MTDQQTHTDAWGMDLIVHRHYALSDQMVITAGDDADDHRARYSVAVPTARLLAMIDTIDPDAMRDYLRETIPGDDAEGGVTAAAIEHEVPEADSPEDEFAASIEQARVAGQQIGQIMREFRAAYRDGMNR